MFTLSRYKYKKEIELNKIDFTYLLQPPRKYTFEAPKIKEWTEKWCKGNVLNLFAGKTLLNVDEVRNDIDKNVRADYHVNGYDLVLEFIKRDRKFDTVVLDPPFSIRKSREKYEGRWIGKLTKLKNLLPKILTNNSRVITWGYSTVGMSKSRGFKKIAICLVCHSGDHNDSIGLVEQKIEERTLFDVLK